MTKLLLHQLTTTELFELYSAVCSTISVKDRRSAEQRVFRLRDEVLEPELAPVIPLRKET